MKKLEQLEKRRDQVKSLLSTKDDISKSFYGGMVGFKNGTSRKKWERGIDKKLDLTRELKDLESKIDRIKNPLIRKKADFVEPSSFSIGDKAIQLGAGCLIEVIRINRKTVTIKYNGGFKETVKANLLKKIK